MRIGDSIALLSAQRWLERSSQAISRSLQRLASGKRINSSRDGAAELAIGTRLESQRRGISQSIRNFNDANGILQTADGALGVQVEIIHRMRELALQAANGTLSAHDRSLLDTEVQSLFEEFNRVANQTEFNGQKVLDGSFGQTYLQIGQRLGDTINVSLSGSRAQDVMKATVGSGTFTAQSTFEGGTALSGGWIRDYNGDGHVDWISQTGISLGNGTGGFGPTSAYTSASALSYSRYGDLNADGILDHIGTDGGVNYWVQLGTEGGGFGTESLAFNSLGNGGVLGDFDEDGKLDLMVDDFFAAAMSFHRGRGDGSFELGVQATLVSTAIDDIFTGIAGTEKMAMADINKDGHLDIVRSTTSFTEVMLGNGQGALTRVQTFASSGQRHSLLDVTGDGNIDLILNSGTDVLVYRGSGDGTFSSAVTSTALGTLDKELMGDINEDGAIDFVTTSGTVYFSNKDGTFANVGSLGFTPSALGDINEDGHLEIIRTVGSTTYLYDPNLTQTYDSNKIGVSSQAEAENFLNVLDNALDNIGAQRAAIGAISNRLESAYNHAQTQLESVQSAAALLNDTDIAEEAAELVRNQILQQAQVSVVAQANLQMQLALALLKF